MPFTPFHFGPGAAIHALAPKRISFLAFCAANVLIDVEPLYFMLTAQYPLHRFFHTYVGATLVVGATVASFVAARRLSARLILPNLLGWRDLGLWPVVFGAVVGGYSHVVLDSVMHRDMVPFSPFSAANPLLHIVPVGALHLACVAAGVFAICVLLIRWRLGRRVLR